MPYVSKKIRLFVVVDVQIKNQKYLFVLCKHTKYEIGNLV